MGKLFIGILLLAAVALGWFILNPGDTFDYVVTIESEVSQLESELAELDAAVEAGTLSAAQATEAKVKIITRLDTIKASATASEKAQLTSAQKKQLTEGLDRLKNILIAYQATLTVVEDTAVEADVSAALATRGKNRSSDRHLNLIVADTIESVEETVQDSIQDYEADATLDAEVEAIIEAAEIEEAADGMEEESVDEMMDDNMDDATTTEEVASEEMPTMDDPETEEMMVDDSSATVEGEAEVELAQ